MGAATFQLTSHFGEVVGLDISKTALEAANKLKEAGKLEYDCKV